MYTVKDGPVCLLKHATIPKTIKFITSGFLDSAELIMEQTIWFGTLSAASALSGVCLSQLFELRKRKSEERRWYADYFFGRRIDVLNNLYASLVDCHFAMNFFGNCPPSTLQEFKERVRQKEEAYLRAKVLASVYLDVEGEKKMSDALGAFRQASMAIWLSLPDDQCPANKNSYHAKTRNLDWNGFVASYESAVAWLKLELNPEAILRYIEKFK